MRTVTALAAFIVVTSSVVYAQARHPWTFEELTAKADCVLIGDVVDTLDKGQTAHPEANPPYPVVEFDTTFTIKTVFKPCEGGAVGATIHLKYYATDFARLGQGVINGGSSLNLAMGNSYLLFVKRTTATVYEPLSGHTWPTMAVYPLASPADR